ncbi:MAG: M23 family metallopeptidase, partial [Synergistaceae bacterium]|nr:M23 family metallopeptidase [Synergistaceae bacterium]
VFNSGIDIKASQGAPVKAAAGGEVLYTGWMRGFGQVVILDHGGNISTVYAHLSSTQVKEGQSVRAGSVLGAVGNSGTESEYALHFEVRKAGSAQNPMNYLKKV